MSEEKIMLPNYEKFINECMHEMEIKFERYGNSWVSSKSNYWKERLFNEVDEYLKVNTKEQEYRKLLNVINIAMMAAETIDNRSCKYHDVPFDVIMSSENAVVDTECRSCGMMLCIEKGIIKEVKNE